MVYTSVGWVSQFYDTHGVWFSQSDLQKGLIIPKKILRFLHRARVSTFLKKSNKLVLTMAVLINLKTTGYPLLVLINWILFYVFYFKNFKF
jgi:hypothetical protein